CPQDVVAKGGPIQCGMLALIGLITIMILSPWMSRGGRSAPYVLPTRLLAQLIAALEQICGPDAKAQLACFVETNRGLLIAASLEAGFPIYPVNPKTAARRRNAAGVKTDHIDAYLLAKTGRSDLADLRRLRPDSPLIAELKLLTRDQDSLIVSQTRILNQLTA